MFNVININIYQCLLPRFHSIAILASLVSFHSKIVRNSIEALNNPMYMISKGVLYIAFPIVTQLKKKVVVASLLPKASKTGEKKVIDSLSCFLFAVSWEERMANK